MARMLTALLLIGTVALVGCNDNKPKVTAAGATPTPVVEKAAPAPLPPLPEATTYTGPAVEPLPPVLTSKASVPAAPSAKTAKAAKSAGPTALANAPAATAKAAKAGKSAHGSTYTVKAGDNLWKIAASKYGSGLKWKDIAAANPTVKPDKIKAGQMLVLP